MVKVRNLQKFIMAACALLISTFGMAQGLEDIIVETYYISDASDATDTDGGSLVEGSTTYRIYVDMAAGYEIQAVYGNANHTMSIATTSLFFNNEDRGEITGDAIGLNRFDDNTVAVDSYLALGAPTDGTLGVLKTTDTDGAVANTDGFMQNNDAAAGIPISVQDGMIPGTLPSAVLTVGLDASMFNNVNDGTAFSANGGAWSVLEGVTGPTPDNQVLIAQITTDGDLTFSLNVQLGTPDGSTEQYVAAIHPDDTDEQFFAALNFPVPAVDGCTDVTACNYDVTATNDDGSCTYPGCTDSGACNFSAIAGCDDGSCTYPGCNNALACNFDPTAGCDDGSCEMLDECGNCGGTDTAGCTNSAACNYDATAGCDDGSCQLPDGCADTTACNYDPAASCDDGTCIPSGCTDPFANNYDAAAGCDDDSCTYDSANACDGAIGGLEDVIVETFYIADANDATDTDGGGDLVEGAITYRIYADLAPGYEIQAVFGNSDHPMGISSTTEFFNNEDRGEITGDAIGLNRFDDNTVALDSYLAMGAPTDGTLGYLKSDDSNGAIANSNGFLQNSDPSVGIPLTTADGMEPGTLPSSVLTVGLDASMFNAVNDATAFSANGGAWSVLEGVTGPTADNRVLIAQITTDGEFSFDLNIQVGAPDGSVEQYVHTASINDTDERVCSELSFNAIPGCTDPLASNFDPLASIDNGSCEAACCEGNANGDGQVNVLDLVAVSSNFGCTSGCTAGDANCDGIVNILDLISVSSNFGDDCP